MDHAHVASKQDTEEKSYQPRLSPKMHFMKFKMNYNIGMAAPGQVAANSTSVWKGSMSGLSSMPDSSMSGLGSTPDGSMSGLGSMPDGSMSGISNMADGSMSGLGSTPYW